LSLMGRVGTTGTLVGGATTETLAAEKELRNSWMLEEKNTMSDEEVGIGCVDFETSSMVSLLP